MKNCRWFLNNVILDTGRLLVIRFRRELTPLRRAASLEIISFPSLVRSSGHGVYNLKYQGFIIINGIRNPQLKKVAFKYNKFSITGSQVPTVWLDFYYCQKTLDFQPNFLILWGKQAYVITMSIPTNNCSLNWRIFLFYETRYLHSSNAPSWRGAQLGGAQGQLYLFFYSLSLLL
jgi:hypothetical protein